MISVVKTLRDDLNFYGTNRRCHEENMLTNHAGKRKRLAASRASGLAADSDTNASFPAAIFHERFFLRDRRLHLAPSFIILLSTNQNSMKQNSYHGEGKYFSHYKFKIFENFR